MCICISWVDVDRCAGPSAASTLKGVVAWRPLPSAYRRFFLLPGFAKAQLTSNLWSNRLLPSMAWRAVEELCLYYLDATGMA